MDVYKIAVGMQLTGNVDRELQRMLREMQGFERKIHGVTKAFAAWAPSLQMAGRELAKIDRSLVGLNAIDRNAGRWGRAFESRVAAVARSVEAQARRMEAALNSVHGAAPRMAPGGAAPAPMLGRRGLAPRSYYGTGVGVYGGVGGFASVATQGANAVREDIRQRNAGITASEQAALKRYASGFSRQFPSLSEQGIREQARLLIPNVGNFGKTMEVLPEYLKAQVALQTSLGPEKASGHMETMARFIDLTGRSTDVDATRKLLEGYTRYAQLDPEAIKSQDFLNAAKTSAASGKGLNVDFWSRIAPALFSQQGGARTGTDIASAYQNTVVGRGTDEALMAQGAFGLRVGQQTGIGRTGKKKLISEGSLIDETLYGSNPYEWAQKHLVPQLVSRGMLPKGYATGDYSQQLTEDQRTDVTKTLSEMFSNRRGANIFSMMLGDMSQIEAILKRLGNTSGIGSASGDQFKDPFVVFEGLKAQISNLAAAVAGPNMEAIVGGLRKITDAVMRFTDWARDPANAGAVKQVFEGLAAAAAGLTAAGLAALVSAIGPGGILIGGIGALIKLDWDGFNARLSTTTKELQALISVAQFLENFAVKIGLLDAKVKEVAAGDPIGTLVTKMLEPWKNLAAQLAPIATAFVTEITSWPGRLKDAITAMGSAIIQMIKDALSSLNPFSKASFDGSDGGASIQNASLGGGAANDNAVYGSNGSVTRALRGGGTGAIGGTFPGVRNVSGGIPHEPHANVAGFNPVFSERLKSMIADAPGRISVYSGYRSHDHQADLWRKALRKYGSAAAARRWVAPPGRSNHGRGIAADLRYASPAVRSWAHKNAGRYGLRFPMGHEPWHIEPMRGGGRAAPVAGPPPRPEPKTEVLHVNLDGKKVAQVVLKRGAEMARFPTSAGGPDTYGHYHGPATRLTASA